MKWSGGVRRDENRGSSNTSFEIFEGRVLGCFPAPSGVVPSQVEEGAGVFRKAFDKALVEVGKAEKGLHLLLVCRSGPFSDTSNLDGVHCDGVVRDDHSEVLNSGFLKLAFIRLEIQLVLLQDLQGSSGDFSMFVDSLYEDEDVIQVDHNYTF